MDDKIQILLNGFKNSKSVNVDTFNKIELSNNLSKLTEYEITNILSVTEIFDAEREANENYRIYGKIEYLSLLNGLANNYTLLENFFTPQKIDSKNLIDSFDFYLVKPASSGYIEYNVDSTGSGQYIRMFDVIAKLENFDVFPAGFSNNVYGEQTYSFNINKDIDVSTYVDNFNFPLTELFIYLVYKKELNGELLSEGMFNTIWDVTQQTKFKQTFSPVTLNIGDVVYGDLIEYNRNEFTQTEITNQTHYIWTQYRDYASQPIKRLYWKYNPFISIRLRYLSNDLDKANINDTSYELVTSIPDYATLIDNNGNYLWRSILPQGYIDPLTEIGVDYPFVNKKRYLFTNIVFDIIPDLDDINTRTVFNEIWFTQNSITLNTTPIGDINDIGKPCQ